MKTKRPALDDYFMAIACLVATRGTCPRRKVGCVLVDAERHIMATGYNGVASGVTHCLDVPCPGRLEPSATGLELCEAIHAEQNALLQCRNVGQIDRVYCTTAPCVTCTKLFMNTSATKIVFLEDYPQADAAAALWAKSRGPESWTKLRRSSPILRYANAAKAEYFLEDDIWQG